MPNPITAPAPVHCTDCSALCVPSGCGTGYAELPSGLRVCYPCADNRERENIGRGLPFFGYLQGSHIVTWSGGLMFYVKQIATRRNGGACAGKRHYIRARSAVDGTMWYGSGPAENGTYVRLRQCKQGAR